MTLSVYLFFGHELAHLLQVSQDHGQAAFEYLHWGRLQYFFYYYYWFYIYIYKSTYICTHDKFYCGHLNIAFGSFPPFFFFFFPPSGSTYEVVNWLKEPSQTVRTSTSCFKLLCTTMQDSKKNVRQILEKIGEFQLKQAITLHAVGDGFMCHLKTKKIRIIQKDIHVVPLNVQFRWLRRITSIR